MIALDDNVLVETGHQGSNNAIIRAPGGLVLIDAPMRPSDALRWRKLVARHGRVLWLVNTDHHPDHVLGNAFLPGTVVGHAGTRRAMLAAPQLTPGFRRVIATLDPRGQRLLPADFTLRPPELTFDSRMALQDGDLRLELLHSPGHTPNCLIAALPDQGILFTGDTMCEAGFPAFIEADIRDWIATLRRIEAMDADRIVPGHGAVCGMAEVTGFRQRMQDLAEGIAARIARGDSRAVIVAQTRYPDRIHTAVNGWPSYPADFVAAVMRASIARIHDDLAREAGLPGA